MKPRHKLLRVLALSIALSYAATVTPLYPNSDVHTSYAASKADNAVITFADKNLEQAIRDKIYKTSGPIRKSDVANVQYLYIYSNKGIKSLAGIEQLPYLTDVYILENPITDLTPLTKVKGLKNLGLSYVNPASISAIVPKLTQLTSLYLTNCELTDISFLKPLKNLTSLDLTYNHIQDISVVSNMAKLNSFEARYNEKIEDLSPLAGLPIRFLYLSGNKIADIKPLSKLKFKHEVYAIDLEFNAITDVSVIAEFPNLLSLDIELNPVTTFLPIYPMSSKLTKKDFALGASDLAQPVHFADSGLEAAIREAIGKPEGTITVGDISIIHSLDASKRKIQDLSGIEYMPQLIELNLTDNQAKSLKPLQYLTQLRTLKLKGNAASNYSDIRDVIRSLTSKDFDPKFKFTSNVTAASFNEIAKAAETARENPGKAIAIKISAPTLQNRSNYDDLRSYLALKFPDTRKSYVYISPTEAREEQFAFHMSTDSKYQTFTATAQIEKSPIRFDVAAYEKPKASDNIKPESFIQSDHKDIAALARKITEGSSTDKDKLLAIHDWVANNIRYDYKSLAVDNAAPQDALSVMRSGIAICAGYANLTAALGRSVGIPTQVVSGYAVPYGGTWEMVLKDLTSSWYAHAWNQAYVGGKWIVLDTTWDAAQYRGDQLSYKFTRQYFDPNPLAFSTNHTFYVPRPTPEGLKEYYFRLTDADNNAISNLVWKEFWNSHGKYGNYIPYLPSGHMKNGTISATHAYRLPDGTYIVYTAVRGKNGTWTLASKETLDNYLPPAPSYILKSY
ncbi:transglutaminase domain-containing protein [Paenibacillus sp. MMS18-CY102]|uniref:transglutaminase domain-containing protein n=1 Tax=Paenibacillus sp. MMS18-CY102 TaxID=2682849 RepID=UPI001365EC1F|nr:transglutaminase domain-containing protein [Paenibacillus sp. MMS18-CY102]MWC31068.1 hypothetical protein [Paenibacillus sp. MMS18-CY102]